MWGEKERKKSVRIEQANRLSGSKVGEKGCRWRGGPSEKARCERGGRNE